MEQVHTFITYPSIGGVPHVEGRLLNPLVNPRILLPDQQVRVLAERIVQAAIHRYPGNRGGIMRIGVGIHQANRYNLSIRERDLNAFNYQKLLDRVERMVDSNDAVNILDIVLLLGVVL
ncbi:hypothetical protein MP638_000559 [Amoeboaphelidium occidentale]|nr:hypothetical protein MP638_000559 [Amoeboaphelidium occidentale]